MKNNYLCSMKCSICGKRLVVAENIYGWYVLCENECNVDDGIAILSSRRLAVKHFRLFGNKVMLEDVRDLIVVGFTDSEKRSYAVTTV